MVPKALRPARSRSPLFSASLLPTPVFLRHYPLAKQTYHGCFTELFGFGLDINPALQK